MKCIVPFISWKVERQFEVIIVSSGFKKKMLSIWSMQECPKGPSIHLTTNIGQFYYRDGVVE